MWIDPIVEDIHKIRLTHAKKFNFDLQAIFDELKMHEQENRNRIVHLPIQRRAPQQKNSSKAGILCSRQMIWKLLFNRKLLLLNWNF